jgi:hypothetical protein
MSIAAPKQVFPPDVTREARAGAAVLGRTRLAPLGAVLATAGMPLLVCTRVKAPSVVWGTARAIGELAARPRPLVRTQGYSAHLWRAAPSYSPLR